MHTNAARAVPARFDRAAQYRRSMIAKVQIARKQLAMDEDDYRQIILDESGQMSLAKCRDDQLGKVLARMERLGFRSLGKAKVAQHPMAKKARAMWISLYQLGAVHNPAEEALEAFAKRQLGCERLVWARQSDANKLIEALKSMAVRAGWIQHDRVTMKKLSPLALQESLCWLLLAKLKEAGVVPADWQLHHAMWRMCGLENARERGWSAEDYQQLADALGKKLREFGETEVLS